MPLHQANRALGNLLFEFAIVDKVLRFNIYFIIKFLLNSKIHICGVRNVMDMLKVTGRKIIQLCWNDWIGQRGSVFLSTVYYIARLRKRFWLKLVCPSVRLIFFCSIYMTCYGLRTNSIDTDLDRIASSIISHITEYFEISLYEWTVLSEVACPV